MPTSALAIMAVANSAAAKAAANQARHAACTTLIQNYQPKGATVDAMREYASCVNFIYPETMDVDGLKFAIGALIFAFIFGFVVGLYDALMNKGVGRYSFVPAAAIGTVLTIATFLVEIIIYGLYWVFS